MTQERYEHGPLVEAWLKEPTVVPTADLARVSRAIAQTPQRPDRLFRLPQVRFQSMLSATKAAAAVAILGVSGALLASQLTAPAVEPDQVPAAADASMSAASAASEQPLAEATAEDIGETEQGRISLPAELPAGVERGTIETAAGPARWVHLEAGHPSAPPVGSAVPWGDGVAVWPGSVYLCCSNDTPTSFVHSVDGIEWQDIALPADVRESFGYRRSLEYLDGTYFLHAMHERLVWTTDGNGDWQRVDAHALWQARPAGWGRNGPHVEVQPGTPGIRLIDGRPVVRVEEEYYLPRGRLGISKNGDRTGKVVHLGGMRYGLCAPASRCDPDKPGDFRKLLRFKQTDDGLVVRDDRTGERLGLMPGATREQMNERLGGKIVGHYAIENDALVPLKDVDWPASEPAPAGVPAGASVVRIGDGWIARAEVPTDESTGNFGLEFLWWLHLGDEWVSLADLDFPGISTVERTSWATSTGNTTFFWFTEDGQAVDTWIIEHPAQG